MPVGVPPRTIRQLGEPCGIGHGMRRSPGQGADVPAHTAWRRGHIGRRTSEVVMDAPGLDGLDRTARRRLYRRAVVRPLSTVTALIALYYLLPLTHVNDPEVAVVLVTGLL